MSAANTKPAAPAVLKAAIETAQTRGLDLLAGISALAAMAGTAEHLEIEGDALRWMAERLRMQADDIQSDMDHAQRALSGQVYDGADTRYAEALGEGASS
ncbi:MULTISPECIES: hypothetical protein [Acidiphilium]|uniref:hypothetical protein n=1 Tax=Acidiphilium TaxID=522 RepID=UPI00258AA61B|nr:MULTISPECIES: hypothetical protein [Acidiphilium]HQT86348.1 hypothetical protein [Acidiphilium rubrum]